MIVGIGLDLVEIERIKRVWQKYGDRFLAKFMTLSEIEYAAIKGITFIAGRFAAKEAAVKALGTGFGNGICGNQIETCKDKAGAPHMQFVGKAALRASAMGVRKAHLSITHEKNTAAAIVILES